MDIVIQAFNKQHVRDPEVTNPSHQDKDWISRITIQTMQAQEGTDSRLKFTPCNSTGHYMAYKGYTIDHKGFTAGLREMADKIEAEYDAIELEDMEDKEVTDELEKGDENEAS
jgi:hypothetical protein